MSVYTYLLCVGIQNDNERRGNKAQGISKNTHLIAITINLISDAQSLESKKS